MPWSYVSPAKEHNIYADIDQIRDNLYMFLSIHRGGD
jgi:hypothetical protein